MNKINHYLKELEKNNQFSGTIVISKNDEIVFQNAYGLANIGMEVNNKLDTKFKIASITKTITALSILILVDEDKLKLDDPISKFIEDYPNGEKITLYHLITHTAGIPELFKLDQFESFKYKQQSIDDVINYFKHLPLDFEIGSKFNYSNSGYILLASIIEKVSLKKYPDFIQENIFNKLGMNDTSVFEEEEIIANLANGYSKQKEKLINCDYLPLSTILYGAGNLYSTSYDIHLLAKAIKNGSLLSPESYDKFNNHLMPIEGDFFSGFGCILYKKDDIEFIYQDGGLPGAKSIYLIFPKKDVIIVFLSNYDFINMSELTDQLEKLIDEEV